MNKLLGLLAILIGIALIFGGLYTGIITMLAGSVIDLFVQAKAEAINKTAITYDVLGILFCAAPISIGWYFGVLLCGFGGYLFNRKAIDAKRAQVIQEFEEVQDKLAKAFNRP